MLAEKSIKKCFIPMGFVQVTVERTEINLSVSEMSSSVFFHRGSCAGCVYRTDITAADDDYYLPVDFSGAKTSRLTRAQGKSEKLNTQLLHRLSERGRAQQLRRACHFRNLDRLKAFL